MNTQIRRSVQRAAFAMLVLLVAVSLSTTVAFAGSVHFNHSSPPTFTANSNLTLTATGTLHGLGNGDVVVALLGKGTAHVLCTNPGGSSKVPGQNPKFSASGAGTFPAS